MKVLFQNQLEKAHNGEVLVARVVIGETDGGYRAAWEEDHGEGGKREIWYEGTSWEELNAVFRYRVMQKRSDGFVPLLEGLPGIWDERSSFFRTRPNLLHFYSERYANEELLQELRAWRRRRAADERKSPYFVADNRLLSMISAFVPQTMEELRQLPGVGEFKAAHYGAEVLQITAKYERKTGFPLDWVEREVDPDAFTVWMWKQKEQKYRAEFDRLMTKRKALKAIGEGCGVDELCGRMSMSKRHAVALVERLAEEGCDVSPLLDKECGGIPDQERRRALDAFARLGDKLLKPVYASVYEGQASDSQETEARYLRLRLLRLVHRMQSETGRQVG